MTMVDSETLRTRLARKPIVVAPGVYDALTAHLAERAGFSTLYFSGAAIAYGGRWQSCLARHPA